MALTRKNLKGSIVALVSPFRQGKIDEAGFRKLIDWHIENGTDMIVPCGTTGEAATMSHDEHKQVMSLVVDHVNQRVPVICGAGSNSTSEAIGLCQHAQKAGADGLLIVTPYYNKPPQEGLYRHYETIAGKVDLPIIIYNVPSRTGISIAPQTIARLAKIKQFIGVKEASGQLDMTNDILALTDLAILSGDDALTLPLISAGAQGVISVAANVAPKLMSDMVHQALEGRLEEATRLHQRLYALSKVLFIETNPIPVKTALEEMGMIRAEFRLPLCEMGSDNRQKLKAVLRAMNLLNKIAGVKSRG